MTPFEQLRVWQRAHAFVLLIYQVSGKFPDAERFRLTDQLCRAAASIAANIAEGSKCESRDEFVRFLNIAERSLAETQYWLTLARDLGYFEERVYKSLRTEVDGIARQLHSFKEAVRESRFIA